MNPNKLWPNRVEASDKWHIKRSRGVTNDYSVADAGGVVDAQCVHDAGSVSAGSAR